MKSFLKSLLKILDWFLSHELGKSIDAIMRGRMIVAWMLMFVVLNPIMFFFMDESSVYVFGLLPFYFFSELIGLYLIKRSFSPERVFAAILLLGQVIVTFAISLRNPVSPDLLYTYFVFAAITGLFLSDRKLSLSLQAFNLIATGLSCVIVLKNLDGAAWIIPNPNEERVFFNSVTNQVMFFVVIAVVLNIRKCAQSDIDREIEWQQRSMRLDELASMTREIQAMLSDPARKLSEHLGSLNSGHDSDRMDLIETTLEELLLISQSFSWFGRAFRLEGPSAILSTSFLQQLSVLLSAKVKKEGWSLSIKHPGLPFEIYGPLPSIMLFLFSIIIHVVEGTSRCEGNLMSLELHREGMTTWTLRWSSPISQKSSYLLGAESPAGKLRQDLIRDLSQACDAQIHEFQDQTFRGLMISGNWRQVAL